MSSATDVARTEPSDGNLHEVIRSAERELNELLGQRAETMKRIGTVKQTLVCLARMFGEEVLTAETLRLLGRRASTKQLGFTRACRMILMEAGIPLEARQGLQELQSRFPQLVEPLKDPLASVTTIFNRLVGYAEVRSFSNGKGRRVWEWIAEHGNGADASLSPALGEGLAAPTASMTKQ
jgi:hypothetical protein